MTQISPPDPSTGSMSGRQPPRPPQGARRLAEWVSFGVTAAIVAALAAYLVYDGLRANGPIVPIDVTVAIEKAAVAEGRHVVPIIVHNRGLRTAKDVKVEVTQPGSNGSVESHDFDIDYLPEGASETIFHYLDGDPRVAKIEARAVQYRLE